MTPTVDLSRDQQLIYDTLIKKVNGAYLITGFAGTGKTFLACEIIKSFLIRDQKVLCLAPTHQAKMQLQSSIPEEADCRTIASFLNVKPERDPVSGRITFVRGSIQADSSEVYKIIIIDECSMLSEEDLELILKLKDKAILVFLGDFNQLPPVNKKNGIDIFSTIETFDLTEQHRNSGDVLKLCNTLRTKIELPKTSTSEIQIYKDRMKFLEDLILEITTEPDPYNICYLGFTNKEVREIRNLIQEILHGDKNIHKKQYLRLESRTKSSNVSEIIEVLKVEQGIVKLCGGIEYDCFKCEIENIFTADKEEVILMSYDTQDILEKDIQDLHKEAEKIYKQKMDAIKRRLPQNVIDKFDRNHKNVLALIKETDCITRVSSPFALTIHKSQGRTIPVVYLDTIDLFKYGRNNKRSLLYVGCSRTKDNLKILV